MFKRFKKKKVVEKTETNWEVLKNFKKMIGTDNMFYKDTVITDIGFYDFSHDNIILAKSIDSYKYQFVTLVDNAEEFKTYLNTHFKPCYNYEEILEETKTKLRKVYDSIKINTVYNTKSKIFFVTRKYIDNTYEENFKEHYKIQYKGIDKSFLKEDNSNIELFDLFVKGELTEGFGIEAEPAPTIENIFGVCKDDNKVQMIFD